MFLFMNIILSSQIPTYGLKGYWPFNGDANEFFNNNNNGKINGAILTKDRCGNNFCAYEFDGVNDYIECTSDSMDIVDEVSISLWFKKNELGDGADIAVSKFSLFTFDTGYNIQFDLNGAPEIRGRDRNNKFIESDNDNISRLDNEWHHIVGIVEKSVWKIYVDTVLIGSIDNGNSIVNIGGSNNKLTFGRRSSFSTTLPWNYYSGKLDDILIYNRALSFKEIKQLYNFECRTKKETVLFYNGCSGDQYEVVVNGVLYNENNPSGIEKFSLSECCDSIVKIDFNFENAYEDNITYTGCNGDGYEIEVNDVIYNELNPIGQELIFTQFGCNSIVTINLNFNLQTVTEYEFVINNENPSVIFEGITYTNEITDTFYFLSEYGCDSLVIINVINDFKSDCDIYIPNVINRNFESNDLFKIYYNLSCSIEILDFKIYDRWGNKLANLSNYGKWDEILNNKQFENGVYSYYFKIEQNGKVSEYLGTLTVL